DGQGVPHRASGLAERTQPHSGPCRSGNGDARRGHGRPAGVGRRRRRGILPPDRTLPAGVGRARPCGSMMSTKICIYGAGAVGGYLAAGLADRDGVDLSVVARGQHLAAMQRDGLVLEIGGERRRVKLRATDDPAELGPQDYVIVALKAHQAWEAAPRMQPLLARNTSVVTCQNGVPWWYFHQHPGRFRDRRVASVDPGDRQWTAIGPERAIGCVVYPATEIVAPGVIRHHYGNKFPLGEPDGT